MIIYAILDRPGEHDHVAGWRGRCAYCGHRVGPNVRQTREQPVWTWPGELIGRYRAMRQPRPLPPYDVDAEEDPDTLETLGLL